MSDVSDHHHQQDSPPTVQCALPAETARQAHTAIDDFLGHTQAGSMVSGQIGCTGQPRDSAHQQTFHPPPPPPRNLALLQATEKDSRWPMRWLDVNGEGDGIDAARSCSRFQLNSETSRSTWRK
jgi:hypothetical protein